MKLSKLKKIAGIFMSVTMVATAVFGMTKSDVMAAESPTVTLKAQTEEIKAGDTFKIDVYLNGNTGGNAFKFDYQFDSSIVKLESVTDAKVLNGFIDPYINDGVSKVTLYWKDSLAKTNNTSNGKIATITMKALDNVYGTTSIIGGTAEIYSVDMSVGKTTFTATGITLKINCNHNYGSWTQTKDPGCETTGEKTRTCGICKAVDTEQVAATGHDWNEGTVTTKATCTEPGVKTYTCKNDATHTKTEDVKAAGHDWNKGEVTKESTCTTDGVKTYTCENDAAHTKTEPVAATGHDWDEGKVTKESTCTEDGEKEVTCNSCGETKTQVIKATHTWNEGVVTVEATATTEGKKEYTCEVCGDKKVETIAKVTAETTDKSAQTGTTTSGTSTTGKTATTSGTSTTGKTATTSASNTVKTGDSSNMILWMVLLLAAAGVVGVTVFKKRTK